MISADEARNLLGASEGVTVTLERIEREIRDACKEGKSTINIELPQDICDTIEYILDKEGYTVCYNRPCSWHEISW